MAWVTVNGHRYYRRSRRVNGRVVTEHVGGGRIGQLAADLDTTQRELRRWDGWEERLALDLFLFGIQDCLAVDEAVGHLFTLLAGRCGAYRHRRQWRWARGGQAMASKPTNATAGTLAALTAPAVPALLPPDFTGIPEEDQAVLRAAAAGDADALVVCVKCHPTAGLAGVGDTEFGRESRRQVWPRAGVAGLNTPVALSRPPPSGGRHAPPRPTARPAEVVRAVPAGRVGGRAGRGVRPATPHRPRVV